MKNKTLILVFSLILLSDLVVIGMELPPYLRYLTKPAITLSLIVFLWRGINHMRRLKSLLMVALFFSLAGDIFLVLPAEAGDYFIAGLLSFLLAHIMYIAAFFKLKNFRSMTAFFMIMLLLFYAMVIFKFIGGTLGALQPYVLIYMVVLLLMVLTSSIRNIANGLQSYRLVLIGALLFMISDSILALNKFYAEFSYADLLIMLTYGCAQLFIVCGAMQQQEQPINSNTGPL